MKNHKHFNSKLFGYEVFTEYLCKGKKKAPTLTFGRKMYIPSHNLSVQGLKESIVLSVFPDTDVSRMKVYISEVFVTSKTKFRKEIVIPDEYYKHFTQVKNE